MYDYDVNKIVRSLLFELVVYECPGFTLIRMGKDNDGGYVVIKELLGDTLYSFGVGNDTSFERAFLQGADKKAYLFDPFIEAPKDLPTNAEFLPLPLRIRPLTNNSIMKVDVEGDEWSVLHTWSLTELAKLNQLIIEFHFIRASAFDNTEVKTPYFRSFFDRATDRINCMLFSQYHYVLSRLNRTFRIFHIHVNNSLPIYAIGGILFSPLVEVSFVNRDLCITNELSDKTFPIAGLDQLNKTDRLDMNSFKPIRWRQ